MTVLPPTGEEAEDGEGKGEDEHIVIDAGGEENNAWERRTGGKKEKSRPSSFFYGEEKEGEPEEEEEGNDREEEREDLKSERFCVLCEAEEVADAEPHRAEDVIEGRVVELPSPERVGERPVRRNIADVLKMPVRVVPADGMGSHEEIDEAEEGEGDKEVGERAED